MRWVSTVSGFRPGPPGGYARKILDSVCRLGHNTGLVYPEHGSKLKALKLNETGTTDPKGPRAVPPIARLGKTQSTRHLPKT